MTFRAIIAEHTLCLGCRVTFLPDTFDPAGLPPAVPAGVVVPLGRHAGGPDPDWSQLSAIPLTIETASRTEMMATIESGKRFRLTPRKPSERGGFWRQGRGMSEWVVRDENA